MSGEGRPLALVTGGYQRIGAVIAGRLAGAGYDLALHARHDHPLDEALEAAIAEEECSARRFTADFSDRGAADGLWDEILGECGRPPSLVINNASLFEEGDIQSLTPEQLTQAMAVNVAAPIRLTQLLVRHLPQGSPGAVVNLLDQRVRNPVPDQIGYTISKQALGQATRTLAKALAPRVRVNAVAPGPTLSMDDYAEGQWDRVAATLPLGTLPAPEQVADAVLYLAEAGAVTGQTIFVDGGANLQSYPRDFLYL